MSNSGVILILDSPRQKEQTKQLYAVHNIVSSCFCRETGGQTRLPEQHVVPGGRVVFISLSAALARACCLPLTSHPRIRYTSSPFATRRRDKSNITRTGVNTQNVYLQLETSVPISVGVMLTLM